MDNPKIQLTTEEINLIAKNPSNYHHHPTYTYQGTQASNQAVQLIPKIKHKLKRPWGMVVNTDPISMKGQHWFALYAPEHSSRIEIMDSFGSDYLETDYRNNDYMTELLKLVDVVKMPQIQSSKTFVCGYYCLAYLYTRTNKKGFSRFVKPFLNQKLKKNDAMVYNFVRRVMMNKKMKCECKKLRKTSKQGCVCKKKCNQHIDCEEC